ncbi:MAG TPA: hypothetical protein VIY73_07370 [Polyangiaceae bacterium]
MRLGTVAAAALVVGLLGCGGGKGANSPSGSCPEGTVLNGSDCVPSDDSGGSGSSGSHSSGSSTAKSDDSSAGGGDDSSGGGKSYDKDLVEVELKRAARQVKSNCGSATDDDGKANGPWGSTKVSVVLGRNGHVKDATVPTPYDGKPVGLCIVNAFKKIIFPPYAGSSDLTVDWDVEVTQPKH